MLSKLKTWFKEHGTEILVVISIIFLLIYALFRIVGKEKGTYAPWSDFKYLSQIPHNKAEFRGAWSSYPPRRGPVVSKSEARIRQLLENYFGRPFNKARPDFLRNPVTGGSFNLEIDCYNPELKLGVEYNGIQHYKFTPFFHRNREAFLNQKYRDDMKRRICKDEGIRLIEVPYTVRFENLQNFLYGQLRRAGY